MEKYHSSCSPNSPKYSTRINPSSPQELVLHKELVWSPRFYSCSFCRREFRSSQALGGHMNVHGRDRARLKQQCCPTSPPDHQSSNMQKDSAMFFRTIDYLSGLQMFPSAGDHEIIIRPLFKDKRIRKSDRNLPCLRRKLFTNCKKISGCMEDVDLELRLGSKPHSLH